MNKDEMDDDSANKMNKIKNKYNKNDSNDKVMCERSNKISDKGNEN